MTLDTPQDDENTSALRAESICYRYPDIVEGDICRLGGGGVRGLDEFGGDSLNAGNKNDGEAILEILKLALVCSLNIEHDQPRSCNQS